MWRTKNFAEYEDLGEAYTRSIDHFGVKDFWAPNFTYDPMAKWSDYLGETAGDGQGLWVLLFSARDAEGHCKLSAAFSKEVDGPYHEFVGENLDGKYLDASKTIFDNEELKKHDFSAWEKENAKYGSIYKERRTFIDAFPFIDDDGTKYMYFCRSRGNDLSNDIWGVKMKDWVTPDYATTRPLTMFGYTTTKREQAYDYTSMQKIDEGPVMIKHNGKYYLTFSIGPTDDKYYPVAQAISDSPLGSYEKVLEADGGLINKVNFEWDIHCAGHHDFFTVGNEMWIASHSYPINSDGSLGGRCFVTEKVEWTTNDKGQEIMQVNGPTRTMQPLPEKVSGYTNLALSATVTATGASSKSPATLLNDGLRASNADDGIKDFTAKNGKTVITLKWKDFVTARAIMVYQSYDWGNAFDGVEKIELSYRRIVDGKTKKGVATIKDLGYNVEAGRVNLSYFGFSYEEIVAGDYEEEYNILRPSTASVAEFNEIEINQVKITVKKGAGKSGLMISDVVVLGKTA
jgi:hypothetical protein